MDYKECLKIHGYIADNSDSESECNSNVEEIYNKYKPPPMPYHEFKHRVTTIYADSTTEQQNYTSNSNNSNPSTTTAATKTLQHYTHVPPENRVAAWATSNVDSVIQQQLEQFTKTYQQRTDTTVRNKPTIRPNIVQPTTLRTPVHHHQATRVRTPTPAAAASTPAASTLIPPSAASTPPASNRHRNTRTRTEQRPPPRANKQPSVNTISRAVQQQHQPTATSNSQVPYRPLGNERTTQQQPPPPAAAAAEEEMNDCCCCIC